MRRLLSAGCTTVLLNTNEGTAEARATDDVDSIVEDTVCGRAKENSLSRRNQGKSADMPLETVLDVQSLEEKVLGFTNRWTEILK